MKNPRIHVAAFVCALILLAPASVAQQMAPRTQIRGTVHDAVTHQALARVIVTVESTISGYAGHAETDTTGKFDLQGLDTTQYSVRISFPGYFESSQTVDLTTNPLAYLSFDLKPRPGTAGPAIPPGGPEATLDARLAAVPDKARKEFTKARELWQQGKDPQECLDHLNKAIKAYDRFADAYVLMASVDAQQNKVSDAKTALNRAIEIDPKLPDAYLTLGMIQNREKDFPGAEKSLTEGLKLNDSSAEGHYELSRTYWAAGRWQEAEPQAQKAVALQPRIAPAHIMLGNIALRKQDYATAKREFGEYLQLDPQGPMAASVKDMLAKLDKASEQSSDAKKQ
jgi:Tfp pilus assembly protein PilF